MLTYNGKQSKIKEASLLTFSLPKLPRIAVFNLEILTGIIVIYITSNINYWEEPTQDSSNPVVIPYT